MEPTTNGRRPLWLDGATATELQRAGLAVDGPWWTVRALNGEPNRTKLRAVQRAHLEAGADVLTANTFRCNLRTLRRIGLDAAGLAWMVHAAVGVAQSAREQARRPDAVIAASMAPVEDCYRPDLVPPADELAAEHAWLVTEARRSGVELFLIETMNTEREARTALAAALAGGGRAWVSFVCGPDGLLPSGERVGDAAAAAERDGAEAVLVNCTALADVPAALDRLRERCSGPIGVAPNLEDRGSLGRWEHTDRALPAAVGPDEFAELMAGWRDRYGLDVLGGCCGTTPDHLAAARALIGAGAGAGSVAEPAG